MRHSIKTGFSFGSTSGVITTLGLMVGLHSGTHGMRGTVLGGILIIAIADAFSDAVGIHIAEESENTHTTKEIWEATIATFIFKFLTALTFAVPVLLYTSLNTAILVALGWGLLLITLLSFKMARDQKTKPFHVIAEHIIVVLMVVTITHYIGDWVYSLCK